MIAFLHPWLLLGLAAGAVPILLHRRRWREPPTVPFPAVRYLQDATREFQQRLRWRDRLLLLLRLLLLAALVFAAAGPSLPLRGAGPHAPAALALVLDNSLSSGAVAGGTPRLDALRRAAAGVLARATPGDALWLVTADGIPRRGTPGELRAIVDTLAPSPRRLDLGAAVQAAAQATAAGEGRPRGVVVLSDLQATALSPAALAVPVLVAAPGDAVVRNAGLDPLETGVQPWGVAGGRVTVRVTGDSGPAVPVRLQLGAGAPRQALVAPGAPASVSLPPARPGWYTLRAELDADELRADDVRLAAVRVTPVAAVTAREAGTWVDAALATLAAGGRVRLGSEVTVGALGPGASVVFPPADPARMGALDRALDQRGVTWRFGGVVESPAPTDSGAWVGRVAVARRHRLVPRGSGRTGVLATVGGEPWIVRSGDVVLVGSRLEPSWTAAPLEAGFVALVDALANRSVRGELAALAGAAGDAVPLPDLATEVRQGDARWTVEGGSAFVPPRPGVYWLLAGRDTIGALAAGSDPRESALAPADPAAVRRLWPGARVAPLDGIAAAAFTLSARADLRGALLWLALLLGAAELLVAAGGGARRA